MHYLFDNICYPIRLFLSFHLLIDLKFPNNFVNSSFPQMIIIKDVLPLYWLLLMKLFSFFVFWMNNIIAYFSQREPAWLFNYRIRRCLVPLNDCDFANLGGGLEKGDFYFKQIFIKIERKFETINCFTFVMSIFTIIHILI